MKLKEKRAFLLSILTPLKDLLDSEKSLAWLAAEFHAESPPACPVCGKVPTGTTAGILKAGRRIRCPACGKGWNIWTGTLFEGAKIDPEEFILLRTALAAGIDHTGLCRLTGRQGQAVTAWVRKIRTFNEMKGVRND